MTSCLNTRWMHIAFVCDENYVMPTVVAIASLQANKKEEAQYFVHILGSEISEKSHEYFTKLSRADFKVEVIDLTQTARMKRQKIQNLHVSTAALYKFNIGNLFLDVDVMLYLDGDILIQQDLSELFDYDISGLYAAVVKDMKPMSYTPPQTEKLNIQHSAYFNSGVMLLNLQKMREDDLYHRLLNYRLHGINYFMDQDALNVVFEEKVLYLPFKYNVMSSVMGFFDTQKICQYYGLDHAETKTAIYESAVIVHLCTKYKPWSYLDVPFSDLWEKYYSASPIGDELIRKRLRAEDRQRLFSEIDDTLSLDTLKLSKHIVVSLTSFPERIPFLPSVLESLVSQTVSADRIVVWLAGTQFPMRENDLSPELLEYKNKNVEFCWCEDLRPHKKYFYTMQQFPESIVITVDDDIVYANDLVEKLLKSYMRFPYAVSAMRAHQITFYQNGEIKPYAEWKREIKHVGYPSMALVATGALGVLYPPHSLPKETFNIENINRFCLNADDLWLKIMELINNVPVVLADDNGRVNNIEGSQDVALWHTNDSQCENDLQFKSIIMQYNTFCSQTDTLIERLRISAAAYESERKWNSQVLDAALRRTRRELNRLKKSKSYKIGRFVTFLPRKIRGGICCCKDHGVIYTIRHTISKASGFCRRLVQRCIQK